MEDMGRAARAEWESKYTASNNYNLLVDIYEDAIAAARARGSATQRETCPRYMD
jgi:hypothetical protein